MKNRKISYLYANRYLEPELLGQNGVITIVSQQLEYASDQFMFGVSYCRPGDNFSKKVGIEKAIDRINTWWFVHNRFPLRYTEIHQHMLMTLLMNPRGVLSSNHPPGPEMPGWAREAILLDLSIHLDQLVFSE